jgi:periplasmic protein TonB
MMSFYTRFYIVIVCVCLCSFAQNENVYVSVEKMPSFNGQSIEAFAEYVVLELKFPEDVIAEGKKGTVMVRFTVDKKGDVVSPHILESVSPSVDELVIQVIKNSSGNWTPGEHRNNKVNVMYTLPVVISY